MLSLHCLGQRWRQEESSLRRQRVQALASVETRRGADGDAGRISDESSERTSFPFARHSKGISTHSSSPGNEVLIHIQVRAASLPSLCGAALRVGQVHFTVYTVYGSDCARAATMRISRARVPGRLPSGASPVRYNVWAAGLLGRSKADRRVSGPTGPTAPPEEGEWTGATHVEHFGVMVDSEEMKFYVVPPKAEKFRQVCKARLKEVLLGRRWVQSRTLASFCGICVSLRLAMAWVKFYTRSLYWDMAARSIDRRSGKLPPLLSIDPGPEVLEGPAGGVPGRSAAGPDKTDGAIHTGSADMGYGRALNVRDLTAGAPRMRHIQGICDWRPRADSSNLHEMRAVPMVLTGGLHKPIVRTGVKYLHLHAGNQSVMHIANSFVQQAVL